jgi:hypothetical protein
MERRVLCRHPSSALAVALAAALVVALPSAGQAQLRKLKVVSSDSLPIVYAYVAVEGGVGQITDENGEVSLGAGKKQTLTLRVQRIGYQPWFGKLDLPDTAAVFTVQLARIAQSLSTVTVTGTAQTRSLKLTGFYDRWMMRQKGTLSAVFIGPEELEFRHPDKITNMLRGLNGVSFRRSCEGEQVAFGINGTCQMAILVDGNRQCPSSGCKSGSSGSTACALCGTRPSERPGASGGCTSSLNLNATNAVILDQILNANDVAAIEVYNRGGNVPVTISASDQACGIIAIWTGSRKP